MLDIQKWKGNPWLVLTILSFGFFMTQLDLQIVNIAIPNLMETLHASINEALWVLNIYILVLAVFLITAGRLGDLFGVRQLFSIGIVLFTISSLLCGLSTSPLELIVFRAIEGLGAALLLPQTMTFIIRLFPSERRGTALGIWGMVGGVAAVAGPSLGGFIVSVLGWRWIFYINVPIGVLIFIFTYLFVPEIRNSAKQQLDLMGGSLGFFIVFIFNLWIN
ncbi:MFS transporter [Heyndrickxia coagulans]|uniref:MFS transporter n=1 Tax=Heyndrickxia coagulans TaxID=1398 RepID=UPI000418B8BC|nr:MFS transporter [Heyndrickxia coagulans]